MSDDLTKPWNNHGTSEYNAPAESWEARALRQASITVTMDREAVKALVRPPLPQVGAPPQRHRPAIGIYDVCDMTRETPDRRTSFSGTDAGYNGSTVNGWSGP